MKIASKPRFILGILVFLILFISYFVRFEIDSGSNYAVRDSLLGIIIFHNFIVLILYALIGIFLILTGIKRVKII
jgi:hypothetical protein